MLRIEKKNKWEKQKLLEEITATTALAERQWLIKQLQVFLFAWLLSAQLMYTAHCACCG